MFNGFDFAYYLYMKHYEKHFVDLKKSNERVAYLDTLKGEKIILLIHGNQSSSIHYTPLIELLENDFRIIAPDMRGYGDTTYNQGYFRHVSEWNELIQEFCDTLSIKPEAVAGWSTGGAAAMDLAADRPDLVKKLILIDPLSFRGHPYFKRDENGPIYGATYSSQEEMANDMPLKITGIWAETKDFRHMGALWDKLIYTSGRHPNAEDNEIYLEETCKQRCMPESYWALSTFNISDTPSLYAPGNGKIHKINQPVLLFWGKYDLAIPWFNQHENYDYFRTRDPSKFTYVELESGHSPINDQPEKMAAEIKKFLK